MHGSCLLPETVVVWHAWSLILCSNHVSVVQDEKDKNWSDNAILIPSCWQLMTRKSGVLCAQSFRILPRSRYFRLHQICPCPQFKRRRGVLLACETTVFYRREFVDLFWFVNKKERWPSQLSFICIAVVPMQDVLFNVSGQIFLWIIVSCRVNIHATYINEKWC